MGDTRFVAPLSAPAPTPAATPAPATVTTGDSAGRPRVEAVLCTAKHPNPPQAIRCRQCETPIVDRSVQVIPRPSLGRFRFDDGLVIELSRPLLLGRNPSVASAQRSDEEPPEPFVLPDPDRHLSRLHAAVAFEGWHVLIMDCGSTNGTQVWAPNESPVRLRPGQPLLLMPGARVVLGPGSGFLFESTS